jgi:Flp pilus assembly protein TadB
VYSSYRVSERLWPFPRRITSADALSATCVDFYRRGLERQRQGYAVGPWDLGILVVIFLTILLSAVLRRSLSPVPIILIGIFIVLAFVARWRESRRVRRELEALNEFEK